MTKLLDETAFVRRDEGVVVVTGTDRLSYLHTLLSQDLADARPGDVADFLYLDAKGDPLAMGRAIVRAGEVWLVVPAGVAGGFAEALERFTFLNDASAVDASAELVLASVRGGPDGDAAVPAPGARSQPLTAAPHGEGMVVRDRDGGIDLIGTPAWVDERLEALDLPEATAEDWERHRIARGLPAWEREVRPGRRTQELGLLPTHVHLRKGCYPGQESIAKIHNLGRPRRALAVLATVKPAVPGTAVTAADARDGEVTSAAALDDGSGVALALVGLTREGALPGDLAVDGEQAEVVLRVGEGRSQPGAGPVEVAYGQA